MVFRKSLSDSMSPQVFKILLSILADLNKIVFIRLPNSDSPVILTSICGPFQVLQSQLVSSSPSCSTAFLVLRQRLSTCFFFSFIDFHFGKFFICCSLLLVLFSGNDHVIYLHLKIPVNFMLLILSDGF